MASIPPAYDSAKGDAYFVQEGIVREKAIKIWPRAWKHALIEKENPDWRDLYAHLPMV